MTIQLLGFFITAVVSRVPHVQRSTRMEPGLAENRRGEARVRTLRRRSFGIGLQQQAEPAEFTLEAVVKTLAIGKALGQSIAGDFIELGLLADQVHGERQVRNRGFTGRDQLGFFVQPFLGRTAVTHPCHGAHVVVAGIHQIRFGADEIIAPVSGLHVGDGQDQAGAAQPLQVGDAHLAEAVVTHALRPWHFHIVLFEAFAAVVHVYPETVGLQVDQVNRARAVQVRQPHPRRIELGIFEIQLAQDETFAKFSMPQIRPAFDFVVADADQVLCRAAQWIAESHQFGLGTAQQGQRVVVVRDVGPLAEPDCTPA
ncbi:hypothetical protein D3C86_1102840 [compost metagenome]